MKNAIKEYILKPEQVVKNGKTQPNGANTTQAISIQSSESQAVSTGPDEQNSTPQSNEEPIDEVPAQDMLGINPGTPDNVTYSGDEDTTVDDIKDDYDEITLQDSISLVQNHGDVTIFNDELATAIQYIWKNEPRIKEGFRLEAKNKNKILDETTEYFWDDIDRIKAEDYVPNETDIINVRYRTTGTINHCVYGCLYTYQIHLTYSGVIEKRFEINNAKFHIFDVGGQKSERKKWINCFNEVKAVIFVISLSCFNEMMYEDLNKNCMVDSLELFASTINNKHFTDTHIILFLNKKDLFATKIAQVPITACPAFHDFDQFNHEQTIHSNPKDYEQTTCYIKFKFESLNENSKRKQIYTHLTCAMERTNIENVFNDVKHIVITQNLFNEGLS